MEDLVDETLNRNDRFEESEDPSATVSANFDPPRYPLVGCGPVGCRRTDAGLVPKPYEPTHKRF